MTIGLVSDTHGYFESKLKEVFTGVETILHAGDVGDDSVLDELGEIAPVRAVRGNVDSTSSGLPLSLQVNLGGVDIHVVHILSAAQSNLETWAESAREAGPIPKPAERLVRTFDPPAEVVIFGHSHRPCLLSMGGILWINPGSAGRKRFSLPRTCAVLEVSARNLKARIVRLESGTKDLPAPILMHRKRREAL
ncbi:MAG TPA: metallophosphoesterase family protein [Terriglobia bacterium]|nr:metallophosphoesterase family protein [Terriglobia bacterium]